MTKLSMTCSHPNFNNSNIFIVPIMWNGHFIEHYKIKYCIKVHIESSVEKILYSIQVKIAKSNLLDFRV